jgi:mycofactocin precursor
MEKNPVIAVTEDTSDSTLIEDVSIDGMCGVY